MKRLKLKEWIRFSDIRKNLSDGIDVPENILSALEMAGTKEKWETLPWYETGEAFSLFTQANEITIDFPILKNNKQSEESSTVPWDYPERSWYSWAHLIAKNYGWNLDYIAELDIDDALALIQEIEVSEQLEKEFSYQISEIAYQYDSASKKSKFVPFPRPLFMQEEVTFKVVKRKFPVGLMPVGNVIKINEDKEIEH